MTRHSSAVLNASQAVRAVTSSQWSAARNPTGARSCAAPAFFKLSPSAAWCLIRDRDRFDSPPDETVVQSYWAQRGGGGGFSSGGFSGDSSVWVKQTFK